MIRTRFLSGLMLLCVAASPATADSFARYHPDQAYFVKATEAFQRGRLTDTAQFLGQSARYGDKTAQFALALLARDGVGRDIDPVEAYAWLDVAAERGYPMFLAEREAHWLKLSEAQQARALERAARVHAEYGDRVAKPRLERLLRLGKSRRTGTRTGSGASATGVAQMDAASRAAFLAAFLTKANPGVVGGSAELAAEFALTAFGAATGQAAHTGFASSGDYYDDANWEPALYWYTRDAPWLHGRVTVRALRPAESADAAAPQDRE